MMATPRVETSNLNTSSLYLMVVTLLCSHLRPNVLGLLCHKEETRYAFRHHLRPPIHRPTGSHS